MKLASPMATPALRVGPLGKGTVWKKGEKGEKERRER